MTITDILVYDFAVHGAANNWAIDCTDALEVDIWIRDLTFGSSDRIGVCVSDDGGATKENATGEYEALSMNYTPSTNTMAGNVGFTFTSFVLDDAGTAVHDAHIKVTGVASSTLRTQFRSQATDNLRVHHRRGNRVSAAAENALILFSLASVNASGGQIMARVTKNV